LDTPFSTLIRTASHEQHTEAETSSFMGDLLGGRLGVDAYARYTEQLWFVYRALEEGAEALREDPVAGPFVRPELFRTAALEQDLAHLNAQLEELSGRVGRAQHLANRPHQRHRRRYSSELFGQAQSPPPGFSSRQDGLSQWSGHLDRVVGGVETNRFAIGLGERFSDRTFREPGHLDENGPSRLRVQVAEIARLEKIAQP
jgi:hypothetical protein